MAMQGKDFHKDAGHLADQLIPQHRAILDAKSLEERQHGQATCRDLRTSVMHSLPHRLGLASAMVAPVPIRRLGVGVGGTGALLLTSVAAVRVTRLPVHGLACCADLVPMAVALIAPGHASCKRTMNML